MVKRIKINGTIVIDDFKDFYDAFEMENTAPSDVSSALPENGEDIIVEINSYGGYVDAGNQIYTDLLNYPGNVTVDVIMAGSAASIIAMAGQTVRMLPVGQIMIHNVSSMASGDYNVMNKASTILQTTNSSLANAYVEKTGLSKDEVLELMDEETWLDADDALTFGFADEILTNDEKKPLLVASHAPIIPEEVIEGLKNKKQKMNVDTDELADKVIAKLEAKNVVFNNQAENKKPEHTMLDKFTNLINKGD